MLRRIPILQLFLLTLLLPICGKAQVWPGDVNNNGIVNHFDFIYLASAFGEFGPPRSEISVEFSEQTIDALWGIEVPGSDVDLAYADCNGDGIIDLADQIAIHQNYGLTHGVVINDTFEPGDAGEDIPITLEYVAGGPDIFQQGFPLLLHINLGTEDFPVEDFQGLAFTINLDSDVFVDDVFDFIINDFWVPNAPFFNIIDPDINDGNIQIALHRIDQGPIAEAFGVLGTIFLVIEDDVVGMSDPDLETIISIENIQLLNDGGEVLPVVNDSVDIVIVRDPILSGEENLLENSIELYPNPASNTIQIESTYGIDYLELYNSYGQLVLRTEEDFVFPYSWNLPALSQGGYFIKIQTSKGTISRKVIIQQE